MPVNGNTTSLNIGMRNFSDYNARQISKEISRENYRTVVVSDQRMQKFRNAVYKMVNKWAYSDKMNLIIEYGDAAAVGRNPSEEALNRALTESIIIHLEPSDLEQLYKDIVISTESLKKDIKKLNTRPKSNFTLNMRTFEKANAFLKDSRSADEYIKNRDKLFSGFKVPKNIQSQYRNLTRELLDVLTECFNVVELSSLAFSMGIHIRNKMPAAELKRHIINKTLLYVDLIVGKNKKVSSLAGAFNDPAPYEKILEYTSYAYITGNPNIDPTTWKAKKDAARRAKKAIQERAKMQSDRVNSTSRLFKDVAGFNAKNLKKAAKKLNQEDTGVLAGVDFDTLIELAGKYGVDPKLLKGNNEGELKAHIYSAMAAENKRISKLYKNISKAKTFEKKRNALDFLSVHDENIPGGDGGSGSYVPTVSFKADGSLASTAILEAVPVYLVGQGSRGDAYSKALVKKGLASKRPSDSLTRVNRTGGTESKQLDPKDLSTFDWIMGLKNDLGSTEKLEFKMEIETLRQLDARFEWDSKLAVDMTKFGGFKEVCKGLNININAVYAYVYACATNRKDLAEAIRTRYKIPKVNVIKKVRRALRQAPGKALKAIGKLALGILTLGIGTGIIKGIKKRVKYKSGNFEDLPQRDKDFYTALSGQSIHTLVNMLISKYKFNMTLVKDFLTEGIAANGKAAESIEEVVNFADKKALDSKKNGLIACIARAAGMNLTAWYAEQQMNDFDLKKSEAYKALRKGAGRSVFRKVASIFKSFGNFFRKNKRSDNPLGLKGPEELISSDKIESLDDTGTNEAGKGPIPVLPYSGGKLNNINRVIPVYVVNNETGGSDGNKDDRQGIGRNADLADDYNKKNNPTGNIIGGKGPGFKLGDNKVEFTKNAATIISEMIAAGHNPDSKAIIKNPEVLTDGSNGTPIPGPGKPGKKYALTTRDLEWAKKNNFKFAQGAYSFIAGDSLNGRENPELVTINGNGSFSVNPLQSAPSNNFSEMSLDKFATGISGLLPSIFSKNPEVELVEPRDEHKTLNAGYISADALSVLSEEKYRAVRPGIQSVLVVNDSIETILMGMQAINTTISSNFKSLLTGLAGPWTLAAPYGVGAMMNPAVAGTGITQTIADTALDAAHAAINTMQKKMQGANTGAIITKANTGATIRRKDIARFSTGGTSVITGDAAGQDMFAHGAKPELVQSNGDMIVTPLNKMGTQNNQRISRMTTTERKAALATGISSHIVRYAYKLPAGATDLTDSGEAIKVFSVKPGITDPITVAGGETTLAELIAGIYSQLVTMTAEGAATNQILGAIATNTAAAIKPSTKGSSNPFTDGFPDALDGITGGN